VGLRACWNSDCAGACSGRHLWEEAAPGSADEFNGALAKLLPRLKKELNPKPTAVKMTSRGTGKQSFRRQFYIRWGERPADYSGSKPDPEGFGYAELWLIDGRVDGSTMERSPTGVTNATQLRDFKVGTEGKTPEEAYKAVRDGLQAWLKGTL